MASWLRSLYRETNTGPISRSCARAGQHAAALDKHTGLVAQDLGPFHRDTERWHGELHQDMQDLRREIGREMRALRARTHRQM